MRGRRIGAALFPVVARQQDHKERADMFEAFAFPQR